MGGSEPKDPLDQIQDAIATLFRRANDPRGNARMYEMAGVNIERSGSVMLARIEDLQPVRLSDLATATGIEISTASRQVSRLVDQGLVAREPDPEDGRASLHRLTASGRDARKRLKKALRAWYELALADFDARQRAELGDLLGRFVEKLVEMSSQD